MTTIAEAEQREQAARTVERFVSRFEDSYRLLAYHAALPLVLTPELVNYLRNEFLRGEQVPWVAEVDLLLSDLCSQVGYELYAMDTHVRAYLLGQMKEHYGEGRMREVARVLISYVSYLSRLNPGRRQQELEAQRWAAMVYLGDERCKAAAREIAQRLIEVSSDTSDEKLTGSGIRAELARLTRITEELSSQLQQEPSLLEYARLIQRILRTPDEVSPDDLRRSYWLDNEELTLPVGVLPDNLARLVQSYRREVVQIEGFPPIKTFEFEVATITLEGETGIPTAIDLQPFEFEVALIEVNQSARISTDNLLEMVDEEVFSRTGRNLNNEERLVLEGTLANQTYEQIAASDAVYSEQHLKNVATKLWGVLSEVFAKKVSKKNLKNVLEWWIRRRHLTINRHHRQGQRFIEDLGNGVQLEMVAIPGGTFIMGTEDEEIKRLVKKFASEYFSCEKPQHQVTLPSFYMGKYPVTQAQWRAIASTAKIDIDLETDPSDFKGDDLPVERVSWYNAVEFCKRLSRETKREYRLPSEAEWEYACRAGTTTAFHFGETITGDLANYNATETYADEPKGEYWQKTTTVGYFQVANDFGLYDMHGNVWEWCEDDYHYNYEGAPTDGSAWISKGTDDTKILRGGSWFNPPDICRSADRCSTYPRDDLNHCGFRVVCSASRTL
ncbi:MAG: formylglycine-generating enzyme family protein [Microcystis aeruginosa LL13-03]|nr:formylglycine-generating enzyme family protein [Microcystis aeruginosa LL13-03]